MKAEIRCSICKRLIRVEDWPDADYPPGKVPVSHGLCERRECRDKFLGEEGGA